MPLAYRLEDYAAYQRRVGPTTCVDVTRRTDPARVPKVWDNLSQVISRHGWPWIIQFWTKEIGGLLHLGQAFFASWREARSTEIAATLAAQITVTGLARTVWEPEVPADGLSDVAELASLIGGPEHIRWRYDPIIPTVHDPSRFRQLAAQAAEAGIRQCTINFLAPPGRYKRVDRRLRTLLPEWAAGMPSYNPAWRQGTAEELVSIAGEYGLRVACCAESADLARIVAGLAPAACGSYEWFSELSGRRPPRSTRRGSRPGCGCLPYFDVGNYGYWSQCHRCVYCYAG